MNRVDLIGRTTKDIELKYTSSNLAYCKFTLAVNHKFKNSDGEYETDFIQCIAWKHSAEFMSKYVNKGNQIAVEGRVQTGSYDDNEGKRVYTTDIVCESVQSLEKKSSGHEEPREDVVRNYADEYKNREAIKIDVTEEVLPF